MYRITLLLVLALVAAACSGTTAPTTAAAPEPASTSATTTTTAPTTTTAGPTTTTAGPTTTTAPAAAGDPFETAAGTPPDVFDSFSATMVISMNLGEVAIEASTEGIWTTDAISCAVTTSMGGFGTSQQVVATPDAMWLDPGTGFESTTAAAAQEVMQGCPAAPLFWQEFVASDLAGVTGESGSIGGRAATKADLTNVGDLLEEFGGLSDMQGSTINQLEMWIDDETGVLLAMTADVELSADLLADLGTPDTGATGTLEMVLDLLVENVNDPSLTIELP